MFCTTKKVRVYDTDPAGLIFYGNIFRMAHAVFEDFLIHIDVPINTIFKEFKFLPVAIKAGAEYLKPIRLGDLLSIQMSVEKMTKSTFTLKYVFLNSEAAQVAVVKNTHAVISSDTGGAERIPGILLKTLKKHLEVKQPGLSY